MSEQEGKMTPKEVAAQAQRDAKRRVAEQKRRSDEAKRTGRGPRSGN